MNILFITPALPNNLNRNRALQILRALAREHEVHLVSLTSESRPDVSTVSPYCTSMTLVWQPFLKSLAHCVRGVFSFLPLEVAYCRSRRMERLVRDLITKKRIDLVYVKRLRAAQFTRAPEALGVPVVLDTTDAMSLFYERLRRAAPCLQKVLGSSEGARYRRYEENLFGKFSHWVVCSPEDLAYLEARARAAVAGGRIRTMPIFFLVPNIVSQDFFDPPDVRRQKGMLLFSGLMDKFVNIEAAYYFVRDIFPRISAAYPAARLRIVGPRPARPVRRLSCDTVSVVGMVPDLREETGVSEIVVCPVKTGTGTRFKILQAWASGRPVVSTSVGIAGLDARDGEHALIADTPEAFAACVLQLLNDPELQNHLIRNGRELVKKRYSPRALDTALTAMLQTLTVSV